jgi:hypothetical protein
MLSAIDNLRIKVQVHMLREGGYAVRHGGFAQDFGRLPSSNDQIEYAKENPSVYTFPVLFPYGLGGLEAKRRVAVSFSEHIQWCLQHHDPRFRTHKMLPYWAFSILQKRPALGAAKLTMSRRDFDRLSHVLSDLTLDDLNKAAAEEEQKTPLQTVVSCCYDVSFR